MLTAMVTHEVDDVEHWLASPERDECFAVHGLSVRTSTDAGDVRSGRGDRGGNR